MKQRMHAILSYFSKNTAKEKRERMLNTVLVKSVDTNANGTSGYTLKHGPNKGRVLKHITVKHSNKTY